MHERKQMALGAILLAALALGAPAQAQPVPKSFEVCMACHSFKPGENINGPSLAKVMGRQAGGVEGFRYSGPLKRSGITWNAQTLRQFLADPQALVPGNRMPYSGAESPAQLNELVEYLSKVGA